MAQSPGQATLNDTGARRPQHTFHQPVPITARIVWEDDGEEHIETVALGWTRHNVYVRMPDRPVHGVLAGRLRRDPALADAHSGRAPSRWAYARRP